MYNKCLTYLITILLISSSFISISFTSIASFAEEEKSIPNNKNFEDKFISNNYPISSDLLIEKKIWNKISEKWVDNITVYIGETVKFNLSIKYIGNSLLYNISVNDTIPDLLEYIYNSSSNDPIINENNLFWYFENEYLSKNEIISIQFDTLVISQGIDYNSAFVKALECGNNNELNSSDSVMVTCISDLEAHANGYPKQIYEGEYVSFTGNVTGGNPPYSWSWNFNDGTSNSNQQNPTHLFNNPGQYNVTLTVIDNMGYSDSDTIYINVNEDLPPEIEIVQPIENSIYLWNAYLLPSEKNTILIGKNNITANAADDRGIERVEFYLDNNIQYTDYSEPYNWIIKKGHFKHNIKVAAYDSSGQQTISQIEVFQWKIHPILILITLNIIRRNKDNQFNWINNESEWNSLLINLLKNLKNNDDPSKNSIREFIQMLNEKREDIKTSLIINFLNNHPIIKNKFKQSYPLIYFILFYIKNDNKIFNNINGKTFSDDKSFIQSLLSTSPLLQLFDSLNLFNSDNFENTPIEGMKNHPLLTFGTLLLIFLLIKQILNSNNIEEEDNNEPDIENIAPIAKIEGASEGIIDTAIIFSAEKSYDQDGIINTYDWDFGDGNTGTGMKVQHIFTTTGIFTVTLTITDDEGKSDYDSFKIEITNNKVDSKETEDEQNLEYIMISGALSSLLLIGIIALKFRRKYFE